MRPVPRHQPCMVGAQEYVLARAVPGTHAMIESAGPAAWRHACGAWRTDRAIEATGEGGLLPPPRSRRSPRSHDSARVRPADRAASASQFASFGEKWKTRPPFASIGNSLRARACSMAGHPSLRPARCAVTYGAPCATIPRRRAASLYGPDSPWRSEEHTSELQSREKPVCRLLLEKKINMDRS